MIENMGFARCAQSNRRHYRHRNLPACVRLGWVQQDLGPLTVTGTLTHVTDSYTVRDSARAEADDYFGAGTIAFTSGPNMGLRPIRSRRTPTTVR